MEEISYLNRLLMYLVDKMIQGNFSSFEMLKRNIEMQQTNYTSFESSKSENLRELFLNIYPQNHIYLTKKLAVCDHLHQKNQQSIQDLELIKVEIDFIKSKKKSLAKKEFY